ncbi:Zinc finger BED domain-containing protein 4 [Eumeta japonica]|uniref:Zinc finger BED domain-containing protein 4 n=1 Tax=Eumeta variegata TaxID=151549 RepID=A0A4C1TKU9_EUMVA|nr:Zinc finger BED domain-containing protein 4 [Eumeta japonica]
MLTQKVRNYLTASPESPIYHAAKTLKAGISGKFSTLLEEENSYVIATYLDPRYKNKFFTSLTEEKIKDDILKISRNTEDILASRTISPSTERAKKMRMTDSMDTDSERPGTSGTGRQSCLISDLAMILDSSSDDESQKTPEINNTDVILKKELLTFRNKKRINLNECPLKWWSVNQSEYKLLSKMARKFLSAPPASVPMDGLLYLSPSLSFSTSNEYRRRETEFNGFTSHTIIAARHPAAATCRKKLHFTTPNAKMTTALFMARARTSSPVGAAPSHPTHPSCPALYIFMLPAGGQNVQGKGEPGCIWKCLAAMQGAGWGGAAGGAGVDPVVKAARQSGHLRPAATDIYRLYRSRRFHLEPSVLIQWRSEIACVTKTVTKPGTRTLNYFSTSPRRVDRLAQAGVSHRLKRLREPRPPCVHYTARDNRSV